MRITGDDIVWHASGITLQHASRIRRMARLDNYAVPARVLHAGFFHKNGCGAISRERSVLFSLSGYPASSASPGFAR